MASTVNNKMMANYSAIPNGKYAKGFLDWGIGFLSSSYKMTKGYVFYRCLLGGFENDSLYGIHIGSFRDLYVEERQKADGGFDRDSFEKALQGYTGEGVDFSVFHDYCEKMVAALSERFGFHKQYVLTRCVLSGMATDVLFGSKFGMMKSMYPQFGDTDAVIASKKFINDIFGNY